MLLTVGNGQAIGGGIKMCPTAKIDDDMLDFTYIGKFSRFFTITNLIKVLKGKVLDLNFAKSVKCKSVEMKLPNKTYQYDGVLVRNEDTLKITIGKEKINFIG
jgi:diacylglycerol kinase (ATP)